MHRVCRAHDSSKCAEVCPVEACQPDPPTKRPKNKLNGEIQETASVSNGFPTPNPINRKGHCELLRVMIRNGLLFILVINDC